MPKEQGICICAGQDRNQLKFQQDVVGQALGKAFTGRKAAEKTSSRGRGGFSAERPSAAGKQHSASAELELLLP